MGDKPQREGSVAGTAADCVEGKLEKRSEISVVPSPQTLAQVEDFLDEAMDDAGISMKIKCKLNIAIDEIMTNIVEYSTATWAQAVWQVTERAWQITFRDNGFAYDPLAKEDPDTTLSAQERQIGGLGIFMVKELMDNVCYRYADGMNELTMEMFRQ